ncbi:MAG: MBL fold metallo-hydrolase, partial [Bacteroidota bacterium]
LQVWYTPGHSAGHVSFFHAESNNLFSGDVLFQGSIGRTDLPGGSFPVLMETIRDQFLPLDDQVTVYPGHGPKTTIGAERQANPFILEYLLKG